jgi:hypothetical protein
VCGSFRAGMRPGDMARHQPPVVAMAESRRVWENWTMKERSVTAL